jgi:hypothetical protein
MPMQLTYTRVDEVIECYDITSATRGELMQLMPNAYGGELPGENDVPEPDNSRDAPYLIKRIWSKLSVTSKQDIINAVKNF